MSINIIREFMDMKQGVGFLRNIERIARALELIAAHLITISNILERSDPSLESLIKAFSSFEDVEGPE